MDKTQEIIADAFVDAVAQQVHDGWAHRYENDPGMAYIEAPLLDLNLMTAFVLQRMTERGLVISHAP